MAHELNTIKLTDDGDLDLTGGQINFLTNVDATLQNIKALLSIRKGEWFLNTQLGLEHDNLFVKAPDLEIIDLDVREAISQEAQVLTIENLNITVEQNRNVNIEFESRLRDDTEVVGEVSI